MASLGLQHQTTSSQGSGNPKKENFKTKTCRDYKKKQDHNLHFKSKFIPPLGPVIKRIHVDPFAFEKLCVCSLLHQHLLELVLKVSVTNHINVFSQIPSKSPFARYVKTLRTKCDLSRLAKRIIGWFNKSRSNEKKFNYRFTGKDLRMLVHNFNEDPKAKQHLHSLAFLCLALRDYISLFSRVSINSEQVIKLDCVEPFIEFLYLFSISILLCGL